MMRPLISFVLACTAAGFCAGCSSPPAKFYTLSAVAASPTTPSSVSVMVGPVSVPSVVDRPQIVLTTGPNQVTVDEFSRWASPVEDNLTQVVADDLAAVLGTARVTLYQSPLAGDIDYRVQVEVRNFESVAGKHTLLDAVWSVRRVKDGKVESGHTVAREPVENESFEALAAAHSRGIAKMSQEIADVLRGLVRLAAVTAHDRVQ